ncbi:MAG: biotin/lipoyl-containing protein [Myxococcota bacterium]
MKRKPVDGRVFVPELVATLRRDGAQQELLSPAVGQWRNAPSAGQLVIPGASLGELEILGVQHHLRAPAQAAGLVLEQEGPRLARQPVAYGDVLLRLDPEASPAAAGSAAAEAAAEADAQGLVFCTPLSGRFYARPAPDEPPFVAAGDIIETGQAIALLEVMKTFNRITYGGEGLPARARVIAVVPADQDDVDEGDVLLRVEAV